MLVRAEQQDNEKLKQQRIEEQNNYMRECFFAHLAGKKAFAEQSKRKEAEEERECEIFNQHKERMQIIQKQKQKVCWIQSSSPNEIKNPKLDFQEKLEAQARVQDRLNQKLGDELNEILREEEERCQKAVVAQDAKVAEAHRIKQERAKRGIEEMREMLLQQREQAELKVSKIVTDGWIRLIFVFSD